MWSPDTFPKCSGRHLACGAKVTIGDIWTIHPLFHRCKRAWSKCRAVDTLAAYQARLLHTLEKATYNSDDLMVGALLGGLKPSAPPPPPQCPPTVVHVDLRLAERTQVYSRKAWGTTL